MSLKRRRGYIDPHFTDAKGTRFRMRWVKEGHDADDPDVPPNAVVFDSDAPSALPILKRGSHEFPTGTTGGEEVQIASWNLTWVPLCSYQFARRSVSTGERLFTMNCIDVQDAYAAYNYIESRMNGIFVKANFATISPVIVEYTAYRIAV